MGQSMQRILLIEDNAADAVLLRHTLHQNASTLFDIRHIKSLEALPDLDNDEEFDVAMLDMGLPGISGIPAIECLQKYHTTLPIIVLTGMNNEKIALEAVRHGVQDYLVKGESSGEIIRRAIRYSIERKQFQDKIVYLTHYDQLTGLMNENQFRSLLDATLHTAARQQEMVGVFLADLDNFKHINDAYGIETGDELLVRIGEMLRRHFEDKHPVCRLSEDSFLVMVTGITDTALCADIAENMMGLLHAPITVGETEIHTSVSIGISTFPACGHDASSFIKHAEDALRKVKEDGRRHYCFYTGALDSGIQERVTLTNALFKALKEKEFTLHYQPKIHLRSGHLAGVEALIRWRHPEKGNIPPNIFIPLAESIGLIDEISHLVLHRACTDQAAMGEMEVSVNLSARELHHPGLLARVSDIMDQTGIAPDKLALELTETAAMQNAEAALDIMAELKNLGIQLHIDDFGTGYSSLNYLRLLPADVLKIDQSFVKSMAEREEDKKIVKVIVALAHDMGMKVVAEGIETELHANILRTFNCETGQGYLFAKPMPLSELLEWRTATERF